MTANFFTQTTIAVIWDFDKTLIPGYMQEPLFEHFNVDAGKFWQEVNALPAFYERHGLELQSPDTVYLNHTLTYVREGIFKGLNNEMLAGMGQKLTFYDGVPDIFPALKELISGSERFAKHDITVEHYIVSTGMRQIILGSPVSPFVDGVWGCEFVETVAPPGFLDGAKPAEQEKELRDIGYVIDNTTKTRAVFEINKGANKEAQITVNARMAHEDRRIPFQNMVYIADGPSDIPVFSILNQYGGKTFAVYKPGSMRDFEQARSLQEQGRVQGIGEANFTPSTLTNMWITSSVDQIAESIVQAREAALGDKIGVPPRHIVDPPKDG
jgi:hypothetical protein